MLDLLEPLHKLTDMFGATGAVAILAWWLERRTNTELQKRLLRMASAQIHAAQDVKASIEALREMLRDAINKRD